MDKFSMRPAVSEVLWDIQMGGWLFCSGAQGECLGWRYRPGPLPVGSLKSSE